MRRIPAIVMFAVLATACTVTTEGSVEPAATLGHAPKPVASGELTGLLLSPGDLNTIVGSSALTVLNSGDRMYVDRIADNDCLGPYSNAEQRVYDGSGWTGLQRQLLREDTDAWQHMVFQSVVSFPDALAAGTFYSNQVDSWTECNNRTVNDRDLDKPDARSGINWTLTTATEHNGILTMDHVQEGGNGWSCQRALAARNNVIIDVNSCGDNIGDQSARITEKIAEKVAATE